MRGPPVPAAPAEPPTPPDPRIRKNEMYHTTFGLIPASLWVGRTLVGRGGALRAADLTLCRLRWILNDLQQRFGQRELHNHCNCIAVGSLYCAMHALLRKWELAAQPSIEDLEWEVVLSPVKGHGVQHPEGIERFQGPQLRHMLLPERLGVHKTTPRLVFQEGLPQRALRGRRSVTCHRSSHESGSVMG